MKIKFNGKEISFDTILKYHKIGHKDNISVRNGILQINGNNVIQSDRYDIKIEIEGDCGNINTNGSVTVTGNAGNIDTTGSVSVGNDCNDIDTTGNVTVYGNVKGDIDTVGRVTVKGK